MSYDVTVFFNDNEIEINKVAEKLKSILGLEFEEQVSDRGSVECRVLGLEFELLKRPQYLSDDEDMEFSKFDFQLEITSRIAASDIIHPTAFMIAETLSVNYTKSMLCLSGVELLGAIFVNGKLVRDNMEKINDLVASARWLYK